MNSLRLFLVGALLLVGSAPAWAFPDNGVLDSCVRADETPLNATNWGTPIWAGANSVRILSSTCVTNGSGGDTYWKPSFNADQEVYATLAAKHPTNAGGFGFYLRTNTPNTSGLDAIEISYIPSGGTDSIEVYKMINEVETLLGTCSQEVSVGDSLGATAIGDNVQLYYKASAGSWGAICSAITGANAVPGVGYIGAGFAFAAGGSVAFTNFGGGNVAGGGGGGGPVPGASFMGAGQ